MSRRQVFLLVILSISSLTFTESICAQDLCTDWVKRYSGADWPCPYGGIAVDASGNVYVSGTSGDNNFATVKYNPDGEVVWVRNDFAGSYDQARAMTADDSGNVYVTGYSLGWESAQYSTVKYYPSGDTAWARTYSLDDSWAFAVAVDDSGYVYVTGGSQDSLNRDDYATVKYYPNGDTAWVRRYAGGSRALAIAVDDSGNVYVTGYDYVTVKYYPNGEFAWMRQGYGGRAQAIALDRLGNVYVSGLEGTVGYDSSGNQLWQYPGYFYGIGTDSSGNIYVAGPNGADYLTIKHYPDGDTAWTRTYNGPADSWDNAWAMTADEDGNVYVTGERDAVTGSEGDYATVKYDTDGNELWVAAYNGPGNSRDAATDITTDNSGNVYVTGGSEGGATGTDYATIKYVERVNPRGLVLKDGSADHNPIANMPFKIYKVTNNPPDMTENYLGELATDGNGQITLPEGWFNDLDWVKVEKLVHSEPAVKHLSVLPYMYHVKIDNAKFDTETGAMSYHSLGCGAEQEVIVDHTTIAYDMLVSVEWNSDREYLDSLVTGFRYMSNYLYDISDGQIYLDTVKIFDAGAYWSEADVRIRAHNYWQPSTGRSWYFDPTHILFPRKWFGDPEASINGSFSEYPLRFSSSDDYRTKGHEFGHYYLEFGEEYFLDDADRCSQVWNYGFMDSQYDNREPYASEMSSDARYTDPDCRNTDQHQQHGSSCWTFFEGRRENDSHGVYTPIIKPNDPERNLPEGEDYFPGPNNDIQHLNYDVGDSQAYSIQDEPRSTKDIIVICDWSYVEVDQLKNLGFWPIVEQGKTDRNGQIRCLDVAYLDHLRIAGNIFVIDRDQWLNGVAIVGGKGRSAFGNVFSSSAEWDTITVELRAIQGEYLMLNQFDFETANSFSYTLHTNLPFSEIPSLEFYPEIDQMVTYDFSPIPEGYIVSSSDSLGFGGIFSVIAVDDSGYSFFVNNSYTVTYLSDSVSIPRIYGPDGACELNLDTLNTSFEKILVLSSGFPPPLSGLDSLVERGGEVHTVSAYPNINGLNGLNNLVVIRYLDGDLQNSLETSLKIFKWSETTGEWEFIGGSVDTVRNEVVECIQELGIYALFSTAMVRGDANGDGVIDVGDVVYLINFLYRNGMAPDPLVLGDTNCDQLVNIGDVVYLINYLFKSGPPPRC